MTGFKEPCSCPPFLIRVYDTTTQTWDSLQAFNQTEAERCVRDLLERGYKPANIAVFRKVDLDVAVTFAVQVKL